MIYGSRYRSTICSATPYWSFLYFCPCHWTHMSWLINTKSFALICNIALANSILHFTIQSFSANNHQLLPCSSTASCFFPQRSTTVYLGTYSKTTKEKKNTSHWQTRDSFHVRSAWVFELVKKTHVPCQDYSSKKDCTTIWNLTFFT